jgi:hypothetical protein
MMGSLGALVGMAVDAQRALRVEGLRNRGCARFQRSMSLRFCM